jgi:hypothetical protein
MAATGIDEPMSALFFDLSALVKRTAMDVPALLGGILKVKQV